jgi:hypothetical protein
MTKELYLHLGLHKTASTSFQATCKANQASLSAQNITYPLFRCEQANKEDISNHSIPLFSLFSGKAHKYHINIRWGVSDPVAANASYMAQLNDILANSEKVILSGEDIGVLDKGGLSRLIDVVSKYNFTIIPFALVRDPYSFMNSAYQQMIKDGYYNPLISLGALAESNVNADLIIPSRIKSIENILNAFGDSIRFYPFHSACEYNGGPVLYLLDVICRVQNLSPITICRTNESRSNLWTRLQNQINRLAPVFLDGKLNPEHKQLRKNLFADKTDKFNLTEPEFALIRDSYLNLEEEMYRLLGDKFVCKSYAFSEPVSNDILANLIADYAASISRPSGK